MCFILIFGVFCTPSYAVTESIITSFSNPSLSNQVSAYQVMTSIVNYLANMSGAFSYDNSGNSVWDNTLLALQHIESWLVPDGARPSSDPTLYQIILEIGTAAYSYLPYIPTIANSVTSWMVNNNNYLSTLNLALTKQVSNSTTDLNNISHLQLGTDTDAGYQYGWYRIAEIQANGQTGIRNISWSRGTPLGNIAVLLQTIAGNIANNYKYAYTYFLSGYNDTLTTWEHSTNNQTTFTPTSLANGLYRYLAYIQSDTSDWDYYGKLSLTNYYNNNHNDFNRLLNAHTFIRNDGGYDLRSYSKNNGDNGLLTYYWYNGTPLGNIAAILQYAHNQNMLIGNVLTYNYQMTQIPLSWETANNGTSFISNSVINGLYSWLKNIQYPVARLAFVHADDTDIAIKTREAANDTAVANNFFGSGQAAASVTDITDLASASSAVKTNFNTGQSALGIFNAFSSDNFLYLSQEAADQLDTTSAASTRLMSKSGLKQEYDTPALDEYYKELYSLLGINERVYISDPEFIVFEDDASGGDLID